MHADVQRGVALAEMDETDPWFAILQGRRRPTIELDPQTQEYAVTLAASITQHFVHRERAMGLITYGQAREVLQPDRGHRQLTKILETLAVIRAEGESPVTQVLLTEGERLGRGVSLVVITPSTNTEWVAAARDLMRRGVRIVAILIDPQSFGEADDPIEVIAELQASRIPLYVVKNGDDLAQALSQHRALGFRPSRLARSAAD
jgi:uncharacterized protein (DUF58 family)